MAVTEEEVIWCYRRILGREPESAEIIEQQVAAVDSFRELTLRFIASEEYQQRTTPTALIPLERSNIEIELAASAPELLQLNDRIRETWTRLGVDRPHDSVISGDGYLPQAIDAEAVERFYASGESEVSIIRTVLARYGLSQTAEKICVEYGCGLGRVTLALAALFKRVHGYDISPNHLKHANQRAAKLGVKNVEFHLCSAKPIGGDLASCDVFYSRIVFQHNPPPVIRELIS